MTCKPAEQNQGENKSPHLKGETFVLTSKTKRGNTSESKEQSRRCEKTLLLSRLSSPPFKLGFTKMFHSTAGKKQLHKFQSTAGQTLVSLVETNTLKSTSAHTVRDGPHLFTVSAKGGRSERL